MVRPAREASSGSTGACEFCWKHPAKPLASAPVKMHGNLRALPPTGREVIWDTHTVDVPRCMSCKGRHARWRAARLVAGVALACSALAFLVALFWAMFIEADSEMASASYVTETLIAFFVVLAVGGVVFGLGFPRELRPGFQYRDFPSIGRQVAAGWRVGTKPPSAERARVRSEYVRSVRPAPREGAICDICNEPYTRGERSEWVIIQVAREESVDLGATVRTTLTYEPVRRYQAYYCHRCVERDRESRRTGRRWALRVLGISAACILFLALGEQDNAVIDTLRAIAGLLGILGALGALLVLVALLLTSGGGPRAEAAARARFEANWPDKWHLGLFWSGGHTGTRGDWLVISPEAWDRLRSG